MFKLIKFFKSYVLLAIPTLLLCISPANAEYDFQVIIPPGADSAQVFGINNAGTVTGGAFIGGTLVGFQYDLKTGQYTTFGDGLAPLGINNTGLMVGSVDAECAIREKNGAITLFYPPSFGAGSFCQARGVNSNGKISGFEIDAGGAFLGFIYDSLHGTYEEFLPSPVTIAQGINAKGQNVGNVFLFAGEAFEGSPMGFYGYLREADGLIKYFAINQSIPGTTRARGISDSGVITGWYVDPPNGFEWKSFVTTLSSGTEFEEILLAEDEFLYQKPCNTDTPPPPGPGYDSYTDIIAQKVRNDGVIAGVCGDFYFNPTTGDFIYYEYGFVATPTK